jgi:hypothetical protein
MVSAQDSDGLTERYRDPIPEDLESAYIRGIEFLTKTQSAQGEWADQYGQQPGVIGLAMMSILAHGDDPNAGPYAPTIKRALDAILKQQNASTGYIGQTMYNHGFATLALAEAYGMVDDPRIGPALKKAVDFITSCQKTNPFGAWRYTPDARDADTTVSGAQMMGLYAARNAGIEVSDEAIKKGVDFFVKCQGPDGGIGYSNASGPNATRSAIAVLVFALARQYDTVPMKACYRYVEKAMRAGAGPYEFYHEYYLSQALFQANESAWETWNKENIKRMISRQQRDGSWQGNFGTTYSTASALLSMALNYRFLPIYEKDSAAKIEN